MVISSNGLFALDFWIVHKVQFSWRVRLWRRTVENYLVVNSRANKNVLSLCRLTSLKRSLKKCFPAQKMSFTAYQSGNNRQERRKFYYFKDIFVTSLFVSVSDREKGGFLYV